MLQSEPKDKKEEKNPNTVEVNCIVARHRLRKQLGKCLIIGRLGGKKCKRVIIT